MDNDHRIRWTPPRVPLIVLSLFVVACNTFDALATLYACRTLNGVELNPIMVALMAAGPTAFVLCKSLGIGVMMLLLAYALHHRKARDGFRRAGFSGLIGLAVIYGALCVWHVSMLRAHCPASHAQNLPACYDDQPKTGP